MIQGTVVLRRVRARVDLGLDKRWHAAREIDSPFSAVGLIRSPHAFVAGLATLDYGVAVLIDRNDIPKHLFGIPDLDLSEDQYAEPLADHGSGSGRAARVPAGASKVSRM